MLQLEIGVVKRFYNIPKNAYGFLDVLDENGQPSGKDLFFHYTRGKYLKFNELTGNIVFDSNGVRLPYPKPGDRLAFVRGCNQKGECVRKWTWAENYENLIQSPYCRLIMVYQDMNRQTVREEGWRGTLGELNQAFPVSVLPGRILEDPLVPNEECSYEFEIWKESADDSNGNWEIVPDPRSYSETARRLIEEQRDAIAAKSVDA